MRAPSFDVAEFALEAPEELETRPKQQREESRNGARPQKQGRPQRPQPPQRGARRVPQPPSWQRSLRRAAILGAVVFALFAFTSKSYASAAGLSLLYTILFVPFTYALDRFAYRRWQAREDRTRPAKKR